MAVVRDSVTVSSKQRVLDALRHVESDRVPMDLGSTVVTGITRIALRRFLGHQGFGLQEPAIYDVTQQLGVVPESVLKWLGADVRAVDPSPPSNWHLQVDRQGGSEVFYDEWGIGWRKPVDSELYFDMFFHPLETARDVEDLSKFSWPDPDDPARYTQLASDARRLEGESCAALMLGRMSPGIVEGAAWLRGFQEFYMDLAADPGFACAIMDRILEIKMRYWERALAEVGEHVCVVSEADDMATQTGLMFSPEVYRRLIKPRHTRLFNHIKRLAPHVRVFIHSCGAISELIPDLIEAGVDILNPVQVSATGMSTSRLKKEFGDALTFWGGGIDTQHVLPMGTPQDVTDEVRRRIDDLAPGGGFVFSTIHNIQSDVPPGNLEAMYRALREYGIYGKG